MLADLARQAQELVNAETAVIALAEDGGDTVYYAAAVGKHGAAIAQRRGSSATSGLCGVAFQGQAPVLVCQTRGDARVRQDQVQTLGIETALAVPIYAAGQLQGAIMVLNRQDGQAFDATSEAQLAELARAIAPAVAQYRSTSE